MARITRSATASPPVPGATTMNSSPPILATVSTSRTCSASTAATARRMSSPAARPAASFTSRNESTSKTATATSLCWRMARATSSSRTRSKVRRFASPVSGSMWARRSSHSPRSAIPEARWARSRASAARSARASTSPGVPGVACACAVQPMPITPTTCSMPPRATTSGRARSSARPSRSTSVSWGAPPSSSAPPTATSTLRCSAAATASRSSASVAPASMNAS